MIAAVRVAKAERSYAPYYDGLGARRLTLDVIDRAKGSLPDRFVVEDGPCPVVAAMPGEAFVAFLERASEILYKTSNGANGSITDRAQLTAIIAALDQTLPTEQANWDQGQPVGTTYCLHFQFDGSSVSVQYDVDEGLVTVAADGLAVRPGPALAAALKSAAPP